MKPHHRIAILANRHRARELRAFRALVVDYFARMERDPDGLPFDWEGAQAARSRIHQMLPRVVQVVRAAGLGGWTARAGDTDPGPVLGRVEVLQRIFAPARADGDDQEVLDVLDMALGVYEGDRIAALVRTASPFHHAGSLLGYLGRLPRRTLASLGLGSRPPRRGPPADAARLEAVLDRLTEFEALLDDRIAALGDRQAQRQAEQARQVAELAERLDFAERMLARPGSADRLPPAGRSELITPV